MICFRHCPKAHLLPFVSSTTFFRRCFSQEPFHQLIGKEPKWTTAEEAVSVIRSGHKVFVHGTVCTPFALLRALVKHGKQANLRDVELLHLHLEGEAEWTNPEYNGILRSNNMFIGSNCRTAVNEGRGDFMPIFLSDIPLLFRRNIIKLDVALIQVTPPDKHGFCSLGGAVDCTRSALQNATYIIGLVNPNMPRTFGDGFIHQSHFDALVETSDPLPQIAPSKPSDVEVTIGEIIAANLVEDGATLQMGIGNIPDQVLSCLWSHKDLGVHSEMFSDGLVELVEKGAVTNAQKQVHTGKIVGGFCLGTKRLYDFIDNNPQLVMLDIAFVNNPAVICKNPKVTAINSCIEVDITGQVVSDSIGKRFFSGVGGQIDFLRGAALSSDGLGKPILAMPSTTKNGKSKIVPFIQEGAGVVTTRAHVHYICTEYGLCNLFGKNVRQRAYELIKIAHPDHRDSLEREAFDRLGCMPSP
ncbi:4-hydroxybutyrate coenzyme A transferase-like [Watersipora subatra]|uniref:4-hydroxybutyrate coenzyme A transferase-like n=1 Tax=Watersipora subatra TaxID=2589382 RepID=UPI00355BD843